MRTKDQQVNGYVVLKYLNKKGVVLIIVATKKYIKDDKNKTDVANPERTIAKLVDFYDKSWGTGKIA